jgi:hypothetical protein
MVTHLFPAFLEDRNEYARVAEYWVREVWEQIDPYARSAFAWRQPWAEVDWEKHEVLRDGNPIFSAYSAQEQKAIRVIQHPPTSPDIEFEMWLDTFGGPSSDADAIQELVISCALSEEVREQAYRRIKQWVRGPISNHFDWQADGSGPFIESFAKGAELSLAVD